MATVKISGMPAATGVPDAAELEINDAGTTKKATAKLVRRPSPIVTDSSTALNASISNAGNYTRFTNAAAKTYTFNSSTTFVAGDEYHGRNVGAGALTLTAAGSMILNPPAGGSLVVPQGGAFTIKIVGAAEADVIGLTNP